MSVSKLTKAYLFALCLIALLIFLLGAWSADLFYRKAAFYASSGLLVYAAALYTFLSRRVLKPLEEISDGVNRLSAGEMDLHFINSSRDDEIYFIASACGRLAKQMDDCRSFTDTLLSSLSGAVFEVDKRGHIVFANERLKGIRGAATAEQLEGASIYDLIPEEERERLKDVVAKAFKGEAAFGFELKFRAEKDRELFFSFNILPIRKGGHPIAVFIGKEHGEDKRLEEELKRARAEAMQASEKLKKTIREIDDLALLAVRRELKMQEIRERFQRLREEQERGKLH